MFRRRWLIVAGAFALLFASITGAAAQSTDAVAKVGPGSAAVTTHHAATGAIAARHKSSSGSRFGLRVLAVITGSLTHNVALLGVVVVAGALVVARRLSRASITLRGPPSFQI